jgi:hypothetical protein
MAFHDQKFRPADLFLLSARKLVGEDRQHLARFGEEPKQPADHIEDPRRAAAVDAHAERVSIPILHAWQSVLVTSPTPPAPMRDTGAS